MQAMDKPANQSVGGTQEAHDDVLDSSLEVLRDKIECVDDKAEIFENQTLIINEINHKRELKYKEEQGSTDKLEKRVEIRKNIANILKGCKNQQQVKEHKQKDGNLIRINGFYHCPECLYMTNGSMNCLKKHINAVHRKLKPLKCSDCTKGRRIKPFYLKYYITKDFSILEFNTKAHLSEHRLNMHNTNKSWICDCCGSRFGHKNALKFHIMTHLPPSFLCSECGKRFVLAGNFKSHTKLHQGILNKICKLCNKGYATKVGLHSHIIMKHFAKLKCEVTGCLSTLSSKSNYKVHLKTIHKEDDQVLIENLIINLDKLKPNFQELKYV